MRDLIASPLGVMVAGYGAAVVVALIAFWRATRP